MNAIAADGGPAPQLMRRNSSNYDLSRAAQKLLLRVSRLMSCIVTWVERQGWNYWRKPV